ncbi:hypothetical protein AALP_AA2G069900 [Arabis alpina]|uniref:Uncharacterized protein n=1 Tax=Arabis alpina TaxID=50452 RepID=A0A087HFT1_ARAAL|nr:hypothetical protein AALP_AA2G069900 [Arabis alpina]
MTMNLSNVELKNLIDEAAKQAADEQQIAKILKKFDAFASIFNPSTEAVEDLKEKFIAASIKCRNQKGPSAYFSHCDSKKVFVDMDEDVGVNANKGADVEGVPKWVKLLMENEDIPSVEDKDNQASTSGLATTDEVSSVTTAAVDDGTRCTINDKSNVIV